MFQELNLLTIIYFYSAKNRCPYNFFKVENSVGKYYDDNWKYYNQFLVIVLSDFVSYMYMVNIWIYHKYSKTSLAFTLNFKEYSMLSSFSPVWLFVTPKTVAHQAPLSMGCSWQEYWSGLPCPPPGDLPNPGIETASLMSAALAGRFFTTSASWEAPQNVVCTLPFSLSEFPFELWTVSRKGQES